jgi:L-ascorbate metabolism protein UlaG (beta-lactamase superfamily)
MSPYEGALAARWLGLETVLPCHYINPDDPDVHAFERHMKEFAARGEQVPRSLVLKPGDVLDVPAGGGGARLAVR